MMKKVLIIGCNGQDGTLLFDYCQSHKDVVVGLAKNTLKTSGVNLSQITKVDILNFVETEHLITTFLPDEIYYLAAFHQSAEAVSTVSQPELYHNSFAVNVTGIFNVLESVAKNKINSKIFYASSSHIFSGSKTQIQNESTPYSPLSIYATSKISGMNLCRIYRETKNVFASCGILYNHESFLRRPEFLSKKIINAVNEIKKGNLKTLNLGNLETRVDWGYAPDYVKAMRLILNVATPDDFIIASGTTKSVKDFVEIAFKYAGLDWKEYVQENTNLTLRANNVLQGDTSKLQQTTGWKPTVSFEEMVCKLFEPYLSPI